MANHLDWQHDKQILGPIMKISSNIVTVYYVSSSKLSRLAALSKLISSIRPLNPPADGEAC